MVEKDSAFCKWADEVMARVRKALKHDASEGAYVGADAANVIASGQVIVESIA